MDIAPVIALALRHRYQNWYVIKLDELLNAQTLCGMYLPMDTKNYYLFATRFHEKLLQKPFDWINYP